ncbi:putative uncharacterized protein [Clostridium sp. CAG:780]|nr:putative uncharacterized protein [Clostridium sp. CAG:780]
MKNLIKYCKEKEIINYILIIIASIIISIPLANKSLNIYRDDGIQHICRIIGTEQTLADKQFLPMIMSNLCNNFGYSWNIFYSPLTAYMSVVLRIFNFSYVNCLKLCMFVIVLLSGLTMYKLTLRITKNKKLATLASIIYILAPYRITDMYIRTALAELASFIFIPIVFEGLYIIVNEEKKSYKLALGAAGLILTHQVIAMYTVIICFAYLIVFFKKLKSKTVLKNVGVNLLFCILMTSFYWVGLLQHYFSTSYEVFVPGRMEREEVLIFYKAKFSQLFITSSEQTMIYAIGLLSVIGLVLTPIAYKKIPEEYKKTYMFFLITGIVLIGMTLKIFPFEKLPQALTMLQFTFRLFTFTSFFFAFVVATNFAILIKNFKTLDIVVLLTISILLLVPYKSKLDFNLKDNEERLINGVRITENTGRVHAGMASMEYLPTKAFKNLKYIANRKDEVIVLDNNEAVISDYTKQASNMNCKISNINKETTIELPYIYYLGYRVYADGQEIKYTESDNGFIQINIAKDSQIKVKYLGTNEMLISYAVSIISFATIIVLNHKNKD